MKRSSAVTQISEDIEDIPLKVSYMSHEHNIYNMPMYTHTSRCRLDMRFLLRAVSTSFVDHAPPEALLKCISTYDITIIKDAGVHQVRTGAYTSANIKIIVGEMFVSARKARIFVVGYTPNFNIGQSKTKVSQNSVFKII